MTKTTAGVTSSAMRVNELAVSRSEACVVGVRVVSLWFASEAGVQSSEDANRTPNPRQASPTIRTRVFVLIGFVIGSNTSCYLE